MKHIHSVLCKECSYNQCIEIILVVSKDSCKGSFLRRWSLTEVNSSVTLTMHFYRRHKSSCHLVIIIIFGSHGHNTTVPDIYRNRYSDRYLLLYVSQMQIHPLYSITVICTSSFIGQLFILHTQWKYSKHTAGFSIATNTIPEITRCVQFCVKIIQSFHNIFVKYGSIMAYSVYGICFNKRFSFVWCFVRVRLVFYTFHS